LGFIRVNTGKKGIDMKIKPVVFLHIAAVLAIISACNKKNDYSNNVEVIREWNFTLSSSNENVVSARTQTTATFHMVVLADSSIRYDIKGDTALADRLVSATINLGDPVTDGPLLLDLPIRVYGTYASGVLTGISRNYVNDLLNDHIDKYVNVTSDDAPAGLVRGQLNKEIVFSKNVQLSGNAMVPAVNTTTSGTAFLRVTSDNVLYSKIVIINNDQQDPVTIATINQGIATANGAVLVNLATSAQEFGVGKKSTIASSASTAIIGSSTYVTVSSVFHPAGKLRGQVR
jgi:hypothetical protein